jgi:hypothetical protein
MTRVWYDFEFLDDGATIAPISLGMVAEDGRELYAVFRDAPWKRIKKHAWLMANVVPHLPQPHGDWILHMPTRWLIDFHNPAVKPRDRIATEVRAFLEASAPVELWGYYAAYDHVALAQLFGPMVNRPDAMPMYTRDLMQLLGQLGVTEAELPAPPADAHNALVDARWTRDAHLALTGRGAAQ